MTPLGAIFHPPSPSHSCLENPPEKCVKLQLRGGAWCTCPFVSLCGTAGCLTFWEAEVLTTGSQKHNPRAQGNRPFEKEIQKPCAVTSSPLLCWGLHSLAVQRDSHPLLTGINTLAGTWQKHTAQPCLLPAMDFTAMATQQRQACAPGPQGNAVGTGGKLVQA